MWLESLRFWQTKKNSDRIYSLESCCWCFFHSFRQSSIKSTFRAFNGSGTSSNLMGHCESFHRFYWFLWSVFPQFFLLSNFYSNIDLNWLTQWHFHIYMWWAARRKAFWTRSGGKRSNNFWASFRKSRLILTVKEL